jgi:hypothetical protein
VLLGLLYSLADNAMLTVDVYVTVCNCATIHSLVFIAAAATVFAAGFNRTGFVVCSYLIEHCGLSVEQALASFARSRPPGVKHERFRDELHARYGSINQALPREILCVHAAAQFAAVCCGLNNRDSGSDGSGQELRSLMPLFMQLQERQRQMQAGLVVQQQQGSQCSSSTQEWCVQLTGSDGRCGCSGSCQCDQAVSCGDVQCGSTNSSSSNQKQRPPSPPQAVSAGAFSNVSRTVSFACDLEADCLPEQQQQQPLDGSQSNSSSRGQLSSSPLPRMPARCYSSCSVGDNSSIGCSPDSQAEILLQGGSGSSSSALGSKRGYRVPVGLVGCSPVQGITSQQQQVHGSPAGSSGRLGDVGGAEYVQRQQQQQQGEEDLDCFEMDPCGEERGGSGWCDGSSCCNAAQQQQQQQLPQQQQQQHTADVSSLMSGLEAVQLGPHRQQQQQQQEFDQLPPGAAAASCPCSCHAVSPLPSSCGGDSTDPASEQQASRRRRSRLRHSSEGSGGFGLGSSSGGVPELLDNESFGKVTSADLLKNLR